MKNLKIILILWVWCGACFASPEEDAVYFVETMGVGKNFTQMVLKVAANMQTTKIITSNLGLTEGRALIKDEVAKAAKNNQEEWNRNLALSYLEHFSGEDLREVADKKSESPVFKEIGGKQREIGAAMQKRSMKLLQKTAKEAMTNAFTASTTSNK